MNAKNLARLGGLVTILLLMLDVALAAPAPRPEKWTAYSGAQITITGQKSGAFPVFFAHGVSYSVISPRDPASGLPTGKRQHNPVTITKVMNEASPLIFNALVTNENLTSVVIQFVASDRSLGPKITLTNANVASFAPHSQALIANKPADGVVAPTFNELEDVSFTFQKIEIDYGGNVGEDDWEAPVA